MAAGGPLSERALILTPFGRDAQIAALVLRDGQHPSFVCRDIDELAREIDRGAGFAVIALEALSGSDLTRLDEVVHEQEPWSDIPFVVLARRGQGPEDRFIPERLSSLLGNERSGFDAANRATQSEIRESYSAGRREPRISLK